MKKVIIIVMAILVVVTGGYLLLRESSNDESPPTKISDESLQDINKPDAQIKDAFITLYSDDEKTKWELGANTIEHFEDRRSIVLNEIQGRVTEDGDELISIVADRGTIDSETGFLNLEGAITIRSDDKKLRANSLNWNQARNELTGVGDVLIEQEGIRATGDRFVSEVDLQRLRILGDVRVITKEEGVSYE
ncbi:LPS export ABC transporter periplasmic protein LptC [Halonatronum saccharophilum]|uniref:LPS export ABC transporter periplasmic protein LptC n=1 Tax=Halonatronum saccharophilum TaxID=150060 RepID=UPI000489ADB0|nr:LPS export ABC transporter periplasmic protein LptC [Halonatronum saccharophilum]